MEYRSLEINVISARDLKNVNLVSKMDVYVVVSLSGDPNSKKKSPVDPNGNTHPTWNFPVKLTVEESAAQQGRLTIDFKVRCDRSLGDKDVGEVYVPVKDLLGSIDDGKVQFVTYQVRKPSGKPKGELNFSYKWGEKFTAAAPPAPATKGEEPVTAYPAPGVGTSSAYPAPPPPYAAAGPYPPPPPGGYPPPPPMAAQGYPPPPYGGYPPPPPPGYGYPPPPGYGYPPQPVQQPARKNKFGLGLGAGLLGGALGGLLIGDMVSDAAYDGDFCDGGF